MVWRARPASVWGQLSSASRLYLHRKITYIGVELKLPRFRGHPIFGVFGVHNGKEAPILYAGVPPADDRAGSGRSQAGGTSEGVRTVRPGDPQLGRSS